jgi:hypothetical protein
VGLLRRVLHKLGHKLGVDGGGGLLVALLLLQLGLLLALKGVAPLAPAQAKVHWVVALGAVGWLGLIIYAIVG